MVGRREVRLALHDGIEQSQHRLVGDVGEPLARLGRHAGGRQILEELLRFAGDAGGAQRLDEQRAATALRCENQVRGGSFRHASEPNSKLIRLHNRVIAHSDFNY